MMNLICKLIGHHYELSYEAPKKRFGLWICRRCGHGFRLWPMGKDNEFADPKGDE